MDKRFPYPWESFATIGDLYIHAGASLIRWIIGYSIAIIIRIVIGILIASNRNINLILFPLITTIQVIPGLACVQIVLILFGLGNGSTIFMISITSVVPIIINAKSGVMLIESNFTKAAQMMELTKYTIIKKVILPGAAPSIFSGLRIGLPMALGCLFLQKC